MTYTLSFKIFVDLTIQREVASLAVPTIGEKRFDPGDAPYDDGEFPKHLHGLLRSPGEAC